MAAASPSSVCFVSKLASKTVEEQNRAKWGIWVLNGMPEELEHAERIISESPKSPLIEKVIRLIEENGKALFPYMVRKETRGMLEAVDAVHSGSLIKEQRVSWPTSEVLNCSELTKTILRAVLREANCEEVANTLDARPQLYRLFAEQRTKELHAALARMNKELTPATISTKDLFATMPKQDQDQVKWVLWLLMGMPDELEFGEKFVRENPDHPKLRQAIKLYSENEPLFKFSLEIAIGSMTRMATSIFHLKQFNEQNSKKPGINECTLMRHFAQSPLPALEIVQSILTEEGHADIAEKIQALEDLNSSSMKIILQVLQKLEDKLA